MLNFEDQAFYIIIIIILKSTFKSQILKKSYIKKIKIENFFLY